MNPFLCWNLKKKKRITSAIYFNVTFFFFFGNSNFQKHTFCNITIKLKTSYKLAYLQRQGSLALTVLLDVPFITLSNTNYHDHVVCYHPYRYAHLVRYYMELNYVLLLISNTISTKPKTQRANFCGIFLHKFSLKK